MGREVDTETVKKMVISAVGGTIIKQPLLMKEWGWDSLIVKAVLSVETGEQVLIYRREGKPIP